MEEFTMDEFTMEELIPIVSSLTEKFTSKESTSVTYETAAQLMEAVLYCIREDQMYRDEESIETRIVPKQKKDAKTAYQQGYELVLAKVAKAKELFENLSLDFQSYGNRALYDTVIKGMPAFFRVYDPRFNPQNHILTLDYQTLKPLGDLCGVDAIYEYLWNIYLEQAFLRAFSKEHVIEVLSNYHAEYEEVFDNLVSIVLRNTLCCMITGKQTGNTKDTLSVLHGFVSDSSKEELKQKLKALVHILLENGYQGNRQLESYLNLDIEDFCAMLQNAAANNHLDVIFPNLKS